MSVRKRPDRRTWEARWLDPEGKQKAQGGFATQKAAKDHESKMRADVLRGTYIPPDASRTTLEEYARQWASIQDGPRSSREAVEARLSKHLYGSALGRMPLAAVLPSSVKAWLGGLRAKGLSRSYIRSIHAAVSMVLGAAVEDELLVRNVARSKAAKPQRAATRKVVPWTREQVGALTEALPEQYRMLAALGAGLGLRQGEAVGLGVHDVDYLRGEVRIRRQVKQFANNRQVFALPKGEKERTVPLPGYLRDLLAAHLGRFPARTVDLPWEDEDGPMESVELITSTREGTAVGRNYLNAKIWKPALVRAGIAPTRENMSHALRHYYASVLLDGGENIRALSEFLGHGDPGFTLRTYVHLLPASSDRTRRILDSADPHAPREVGGKWAPGLEGGMEAL